MPINSPINSNEYNSVIRLGKPYLFSLAGYASARQVMLATSFNNWYKYELPMHKTASGWQLPYTLGSGDYEYGFIVDGREIADPANPLRINNHSYLVAGPNFTFRLKGHADATQVYLSGDFDDWSTNTLAMKKEGDEWVCSVHLSAGKHLYKFIIDGNWIIDPANPLWERNQQGTGIRSYGWIEFFEQRAVLTNTTILLLTIGGIGRCGVSFIDTHLLKWASMNKCDQSVQLPYKYSLTIRIKENRQANKVASLIFIMYFAFGFANAQRSTAVPGKKKEPSIAAIPLINYSSTQGAIVGAIVSKY